MAWRNLNVSLLGMKAAALTGVIGMVLPTEPQFWAACVTGLAVIGSIVGQVLKNRQDDKRAERAEKRYQEDREWDRQERLSHQEELKRDIGKVAVVASSAKEELKSDIADNTRLTAEVGDKADRAYDAANHVEEKIARAVVKQSSQLAVETDTNKTVHRIENKV